jgi:hypothetical protein
METGELMKPKDPDYKSMVDKNGRTVFENSLVKYNAGSKTTDGFITETWISYIQRVEYRSRSTVLYMKNGFLKNPCEIEVIDDTQEKRFLEALEGSIIKS